MEWIASIWQKISHPVPNFLIGIVFLNAAPADMSWLGWIFIAISSQGFLEYGSKIWNWGVSKSQTHKNNQKIEEKINGLPQSELEALLGLYHEGSYTIQRHVFDQIEVGYEDQNKKKLMEAMRNLEMRNLIHSLRGNTYINPSISYRINHNVRQYLQRRIEAEMDAQ